MADPISPRSLRHRRLAILVAALAAVTALACWGAYRWAEAEARAALTLNGDQRLGLYARSAATTTSLFWSPATTRFWTCSMPRRKRGATR